MLGLRLYRPVLLRSQLDRHAGCRTAGPAGPGRDEPRDGRAKTPDAGGDRRRARGRPALACLHGKQGPTGAAVAVGAAGAVHGIVKTSCPSRPGADTVRLRGRASPACVAPSGGSLRGVPPPPRACQASGSRRPSIGGGVAFRANFGYPQEHTTDRGPSPLAKRDDDHCQWSIVEGRPVRRALEVSPWPIKRWTRTRIPRPAPPATAGKSACPRS